MKRDLAWAWAGVLALALFVATGVDRRGGDTVPAMLVPLAILRGDGPRLDRFEPMLAAMGGPAGEPGRDLPYFVSRQRGHVVSAYPVGVGVAYLPAIAPALALDWCRPGWEATPGGQYAHLLALARLGAAVYAALAVALTARLVGRLGMGRPAQVAAALALVGSPLWVVASQRPWQHGPAAAALALAMNCALMPAGRWRSLAVGLLCGAAAAIRPVDSLLAAPLAAWAARHDPRRAGWLALGAAAVVSPVVAYNLHYFGRPGGYQVYVAGPSLMAGVAGTLFSPSRGLLVFCPWAAVALAAAPRSLGRLPARSPVPWCLASLAPFGLAVAGFVSWWGGHGYGPRFWAEAMPIFGVLVGLAWSAGRRWTRGLLAATIALALALQAVGAARYPSGWETTPVDVDAATGRLWDWRDTEVSRGLGWGVAPQ